MANGQSKYFQALFEPARAGLRNAQKDIFGFIQATGQRQGHLGAMRQASLAAAPFAEQIGQAAATAAARDVEMQRRQEEFEVQRQQWEKAFEAAEAERERNYGLSQQRFEEQQRQFDVARRMEALPYTGFNPVVFGDLGYSELTRRGGQFPGVNRDYMGQVNAANPQFSNMGYGQGYRQNAPYGYGSQMQPQGMRIGGVFGGRFPMLTGGQVGFRGSPQYRLGPQEMFYENQKLGY